MNRKLVIAAIVFAGLTWFAAPLRAAQGFVNLEFTTTPIDGKFSPKHVLVVWVEDAQHKVIKTLELNATKRKRYLSTWQQSGGTNAPIDGVSGATLGTHQPHRVFWDMTGADGKPVPDGKYLLRAEFTSAHKQGPLAEFPVTVGKPIQTTKFPDTAHFKSAQISFATEKK